MQPRIRVQLLAKHAQQEHTKIKRSKHCACRAHRVNTWMKQEKTVHAKIAMPNFSVKIPRPRVAWVVQQGGRRTEVVQNANPVLQVRTVMDAILVRKVRIAMVVIQLPRRVEIARPDITVTTLGKAPAFPAFPVNTMPKLAQ